MLQRVQFFVVLGCLVVICFAGCVLGKELSLSDPHDVYLQINRQSFNGGLPDVPVKWSTLKDAYGVTEFDDGSVKISVDRVSVTSEAQLLQVIQHEACHVQTHRIVEQTGEDSHGGAFQNCMKRFE
jgi:predicted SprT family Zn-dependent metalloprotease